MLLSPGVIPKHASVFSIAVKIGQALRPNACQTNETGALAVHLRQTLPL